MQTQTYKVRDTISSSARMISDELVNLTQGKTHYFGLGKTHAKVEQIDKFRDLLQTVSYDIIR